MRMSAMQVRDETCGYGRARRIHVLNKQGNIKRREEAVTVAVQIGFCKSEDPRYRDSDSGCPHLLGFARAVDRLREGNEIDLCEHRKAASGVPHGLRHQAQALGL